MEGDPYLLQHKKAVEHTACLDTTYPDLPSTALLSERRGQKRTFRANTHEKTEMYRKLEIIIWRKSTNFLKSFYISIINRDV